MPDPSEEQFSDDEIFFGKVSLKEFKKHILWSNSGQNKTLNKIINREECNTSLKIIETHSQPNLRLVRDINSPVFTSVPGSPALDKIRKSDQSFIDMENMVEKLCMSPDKENLELNNTLEVIEYILNNGPIKNTIKNETTDKAETEKICAQGPLPQTTSANKKPIKEEYVLQKPKMQNSVSEESTPAKIKNKQQDDVFVTPSTVNSKSKTPVFKTPANPFSNKKPSATSFRKTPSKINAYQHIKSPIASYIKNCPQVPLVKDVHPRKPLPGPSSIPKIVKNQPQSKIQNKENINLPSVAYKSAKKTRVIHVPDHEKLPQCQWAKKITSTLPRPTVMKHENREMNIEKKPLLNQQEDSFINLTALQAEVSVCTQKTAYKTN